MSVDPAIANLERLLVAVEASQSVTSELLGLIRSLRERVEELTEDVAGLGTRVLELERVHRNEHSLAVVGRERFRTLEELAAVLRAELAEEVASIDARITAVHDPALRALTERIERKNPA